MNTESSNKRSMFDSDSENELENDSMSISVKTTNVITVTKKCKNDDTANPSRLPDAATAQVTELFKLKQINSGVPNVAGQSKEFDTSNISDEDNVASIQSKEKSVKDTSTELTAAQRARIEQNRQRALLIRQQLKNKYIPALKKSELLEKEGKKILRINDVKLLDTGAGFFIEEEEDDPSTSLTDAEIVEALRKTKEPAPLIPEDRPTCIDCSISFNSSFLLKYFDHPTCDNCRDNEGRHSLITKTDARNDYLLKDGDFESRDPPLRCIIRKNPHNERWGEMKLYLKLQVEKRCLEVWGSEEALEEAIAKKEQQREFSKQKKFKKKMQELRMNARSSLYTRVKKRHEHEYGDEQYNEEEDNYTKTCATCGHTYTFEKM